MSYRFKITILAEICIKMHYFIEKLQKLSNAGGSSQTYVIPSWLRHWYEDQNYSCVGYLLHPSSTRPIPV